MEQAFEALRKAISQPGTVPDLDPEDEERFAANSVVAFAVGGAGSRMQAAEGVTNVNKNVMPLPNGDTMLEYTIRMYREAGFRDFLALVSHQAQSIVDLLGDGSNLGVRISYSHDPGGPVGRGGAIRNALGNGSLPQSSRLIVHNPDDIILNYPGSFPRDLVAAHSVAESRDMMATAVLAEGLPATYTGMRVGDGVVEEVIPYPTLPVPAHVGVTMFSPSAYPLFRSLFDPSRRSDFEPVLFPLLVKDRALYSLFISPQCWIQVNDLKGWNNLIDTLDSADAN